jgi:hypothetical protein
MKDLKNEDELPFDRLRVRSAGDTRCKELTPRRDSVALISATLDKHILSATLDEHILLATLDKLILQASLEKLISFTFEFFGFE